MADFESLVPRIAGTLAPERVRALPLAPVDGFILTRIDGSLTVADLVQHTGVPLATMTASLQKLAKLGVVSLGDEPPSSRRSSRPPPVRRSDRPPPLRRSEAPPSSPPPARRSDRPPPPPRHPSPPPPPPRISQPPPPRLLSPPPRRATPIPRESPPPSPPRQPPPVAGAPRPPLRPAQSPLVQTPSPSAAQASLRAAPSNPLAGAPQAPARTPPASPAMGTSPGIVQALVVQTDVDLEPDHQREIAHAYARLDTIDHYELLGVPRTADRKAIKRAYFERTAHFHPDRFFRKRLGPFKLQMEAVFGRMTDAHDTLTAADRRAEYDGYLGSLEKTRGIEAMLAQATEEMRRAEEETHNVGLSTVPPPPSSGFSSSIPPPPSRTAAAQPQRPSDPVHPAGASPSNAPPSQLRPAQPSQPPPSSRVSQPPPSSRVSQPPPSSVTGNSSPNLGAFITDSLANPRADSPSARRVTIPPSTGKGSDPAQTRRELLAKRLTATSGSFRVPGPPRVPSIAYAKKDDAVESLKRRYEDKVSAARSTQTKRYTDAGAAAHAKGDMVAAANAYRVALSFDPENPELKAAHEAAQLSSDRLLADQYLNQAQYEEKAEQWAGAAKSWQRVARVRENDVKAHERAAHCLVKADGNLHEAAALAQRAVQLAPKDPKIRVTLANVYLAAGLAKNAKRELDVAAQLAPDDESIAVLLKRVGKSL